MLRKITHFVTDESNREPNDKEISQALDYVKKNPNEKVFIEWKVEYWGCYKICMDGLKTIDEVKAKIKSLY